MYCRTSLRKVCHLNFKSRKENGFRVRVRVTENNTGVTFVKIKLKFAAGLTTPTQDKNINYY